MLLKVCRASVIALALVIYSVEAMEHSLSAFARRPPKPTLQTGTATETIADRHGMEGSPSPAHTVTQRTRHNSGLTWSSWSEWSTCSSSIMTGFRVRNRVCPERTKCFGDDVQLVKCNEQAPRNVEPNDEVSEKYIKKCKKLGDRMSLSCKLYIENPDLAYDIFRKNSCFFTVDPDDGDFSPNNQTVPIPATMNSTTNENMDGIVSIDSNRDSSIRSDNFLRPTPGTTGESENDKDTASEYTLRVIHALLRERKCKNRCDNTICHAARLWARGTSFSTSAKSTINILNRNKKLSKGVGEMFFEYNTCIKNCHSIARTNFVLAGKYRINQVAQRRATANTAESLCGDKFTCKPVLKTGAGRRKRQARPIQYESPCFSSENQVPDRKVESQVGAELFQYRTYVQRFTCRKCRGPRKVDNAELFVPKEQVLQQNGRPAYCKQGFLKRHGLFIVMRPDGTYPLGEDGRFSIESRTFDVESHCEVVISK